MNFDASVIIEDGKRIAHVTGETPFLKDGQSALDLLSTLSSEYGCNRAAIEKSAISDDFFSLRTGVAGEVTQKFVTYGLKAAIIGDFSNCASKSLRDLITESNRGSSLFFAATLEDAVKALSRA
jgi:hypothetical protein